MSDAFFQRSRSFDIVRPSPAARPLPMGYGLALGATASIGLWAAVIWAGIRLAG